MATATPSRPDATHEPKADLRPPNYWLMVLWLGGFLFIIVAALVNYFAGWFSIPH